MAIVTAHSINTVSLLLCISVIMSRGVYEIGHSVNRKYNSDTGINNSGPVRDTHTHTHTRTHALY